MSGLLVEHRPLALSIARDYFLPGAERKDVEQEAMIALWDAAERWDPKRGASFKTFANLVIRRKLASVVRRANLDRHLILSHSAREARDTDGELVPILDLLPGGRDPLDILLERERIAKLARRIARLSPLEQKAVRLAAAGYPVHEPKTLDNAYQRGKQRLRAAA